MLNSIFAGIFDSELTNVIAISDFLICVISALIVGLIIAVCYQYKNRYSKGFLVTLAVLPAVVCVVIMMVNGNIGAGVATAGAFSLIRFRSAPGSAKEIVVIFLAMAAGLMLGMGYIGFAFLFVIIVEVILFIYSAVNFGENKSAVDKTLTITIPEDLDYTEVFEDIFKKYTASHELTFVKTTNLGSLYRLTYDITLKKANSEKKLMDALRVRNGNLEISVSNQRNALNEL